MHESSSVCRVLMALLPEIKTSAWSRVNESWLQNFRHIPAVRRDYISSMACDDAYDRGMIALLA